MFYNIYVKESWQGVMIKEGIIIEGPFWPEPVRVKMVNDFNNQIQIEAVYGYILKLPRIRFLIADDPGAGKTIMAGLIIKELKLRGIINRILIVVPGHLKDQWRRGLKEKFQETFIVIDRNMMNSFYGENPWQRENQVITSLDFAKQEEILPSISSTHWDLVIVDEAHKMSAYKYSDRLSKTERYRSGEVLSKNSEHLLFLTKKIKKVFCFLMSREPEDVSKENLGFDIRSKGRDEIRYIEVKARKDEGEVALTPNEWFKAKRFKEQYWVYVVANAVKNPILYIINNPTKNLNIQEKVEVVRFIVPLTEWKNKGVKV
jgi:SNF2 family DNA or RNA helicase